MAQLQPKVKDRAVGLNTRSKPIFVLGVDRSGTSMLSEVVHRWGASAGKEEGLCRADEGNPQGYWEYGPMQEFIGDVIESVGVSKWDPRFRELIRQRASDPGLRRRARELVAEMGAADQPWFWKDALLIFALPFLRELFPNAVYLITLRNPYESAISYEKLIIPTALRGKIRLIEFSLLRWQQLLIMICEGLKDHASKLFVRFEALVSSPDEQCARLSGFLGTEYGLVETSGERAQRMAETINPLLWRNRSPTSFLENPQALAAQKELFVYLNDHCDGDVSDFDAARYPYPRWAPEYCSNMPYMQWLLASL